MEGHAYGADDPVMRPRTSEPEADGEPVRD